MQSRRGSFLEALVNLAVGYSLAVAANAIVLPLFGFYPSLGQHAAIGAVFSLISVIRSYCLRRLFNWWGGCD
ncbi:DUF7220 family protein [Roseovarius sp. D0-M9]|uniref:DUF7220 family protein n=1 Tax=Roseovarius sp. D0-M9 TaxID=3127117 RepID=UPI00301036FF